MEAREDLRDMLQHVPTIDLELAGDCIQAIGVDLPIVVINLPHRTDRWQALSRRMSAVGLDKLIRVPAVEGALLSVDHMAAESRPATSTRLRAATLRSRDRRSVAFSRTFDRKQRRAGADLRGRCRAGVALRPGSFSRNRGLDSRTHRDGFPRPYHHERHG